MSNLEIGPPDALQRAWSTYVVRGRRQAIFSQAQPVTHLHVVLSGMVKLTLAHSWGEETILKLLGPLSIPCSTLLAQGREQAYSAVTLTPLVEVASLDLGDLRELGRQSPEVLFWLIEQRDQRLLLAYELLGHRRLPLRKRIPPLLGHVVQVVVAASAETDRTALEMLECPLSASELAQFVQASPEALSRALGTLESEGIVAREGRSLRIHGDRLEAALAG